MARPSFQSVVKLVMGRSGGMRLWIQSMSFCLGVAFLPRLLGSWSSPSHMGMEME